MLESDLIPARKNYLSAYGDGPHPMRRAAWGPRAGVLDLIRGWLKADILKGLERWTPTQGSPQGAVISPLLANIYLDPLDVLMASHGYRMVRYADDFVILCRSREEADTALAEVAAWVSENGLTLHPTKTPGPEGHKGGGAALCARGAGVGDCRVPGQGFEFVTPKACFQVRP